MNKHKCIYCNETLEPLNDSDTKFYCPSCGAIHDLDDLK